MSSDEYRYIVAVYKCRSFSDAARKMNISSQGMGKSIKALEDRLGAQLFNRTSQGVTPTDLAKELYPMFCRIVEEEDRIIEHLRSASHPNDVQFFIGRDSKLGDIVGEGLRRYYQSRNVDVKILLTRDSEKEQAEVFTANNYDYRFLSEELDTLPNLPRVPICELHYIPAVNARNELAQKGVFNVGDLRGRTILTEDLNHTPMRLLAQMCRAHGFEPTIRAIGKTYIWDVLKSSTEDVTFIRVNEMNEYPWILSDYATLTMTPPLDTKIVLQTSHAKIDKSLEKHIREVMNEYDYL